LDCIGGVLGRRTWTTTEASLKELDTLCEGVTDGEAFWSAATTDIPGMDVADIQRRIAEEYAPNPWVWNRLPQLRGRVKLALTNNGPSATFRLWVHRYGLDQVFDILANSEEIGIRKPASSYFEYLVAKLDVPPEKWAVIDDSAYNVAAARQCGMRAYQTTERQSRAVNRYVVASCSGADEEDDDSSMSA
jgi:HAD superfamily hydrolase (TIGR01509 family)